MKKMFVLFGVAAALMLGGCEQESVEQVGQQPPPAQDQQAQQPPPAQDQQAMTQEQPAEQQETAQQPGAQQEQTEFFGQSPEFGNAPENITLEAKNGNVEFSHKTHAEMMDCSECHEGTPGKISGFEKDLAHDLCMGCHKEKGAGPTKCPECHVKQ